jgi:hypothetical protein
LLFYYILQYTQFVDGINIPGTAPPTSNNTQDKEPIMQPYTKKKTTYRKKGKLLNTSKNYTKSHIDLDKGYIPG